MTCTRCGAPLDSDRALVCAQCAEHLRNTRGVSPVAILYRNPFAADPPKPGKEVIGVSFSTSEPRRPRFWRDPFAADPGGWAVSCRRCQGQEWVCENHTDRPWNDGEPGCCGGAGSPCPDCNPLAQPNVQVRKRPGSIETTGLIPVSYWPERGGDDEC